MESTESENLNEITGARIYRKRKELRIPAKQVAQKIGISESVIYQIEKGVAAYKTPPANLLRQIWDILTSYKTDEAKETEILSLGFGSVLWNAPVVMMLFGQKTLNCRLTSFGRRNLNDDPISKPSDLIYNYLTHPREKKTYSSNKNNPAPRDTSEVLEVILSPRMKKMKKKDIFYQENSDKNIVLLEDLPFLYPEDQPNLSFVPFSGRPLITAFNNGELDGIFISKNMLPGIRNHVEVATLVYGIDGTTVLSVVSESDLLSNYIQDRNNNKVVALSPDDLKKVIGVRMTLVLYYNGTISTKHKDMLIRPYLTHKNVDYVHVDITNPNDVLAAIKDFYSREVTYKDKVVLIMGWYPVNEWIKSSLLSDSNLKLIIRDVDLLKGLNVKQKEDSFFEFVFVMNRNRVEQIKNGRLVTEFLEELYLAIQTIKNAQIIEKTEYSEFGDAIENIALYFDIPPEKVKDSLKKINFFFRINPDFFFLMR